MACPFCGEVCHCSYVGPAAATRDAEAHTTIFIDPDALDPSEQQFAASLQDSDTSPELPTAAEPAVDAADWNLVGATARPAGDHALRARLLETSYPDPAPLWREEISSRLETFRARRRRSPRERSLSLDFGQPADPPAPRTRLYAALTRPSPWTKPLPLDEFPEEHAVMPDSESAATLFPAAPQVEESNIIEFPKPPIVMPPTIEELAEPIIDKPRILDAPEQVETSAPLGDISLPADENAATEPDVPLQVASMSLRLFAAIVDDALVLTATAIFLLIVMRSPVQMPTGKFGLALTLALPALFWAVYQYIFLVHGGATAGMKLAHLRIVTFDGASVSRPLRRWRALATVLSGISLGLGLLWALVDEDTLCWHDRITRTYVTAGQ